MNPDETPVTFDTVTALVIEECEITAAIVSAEHQRFTDEWQHQNDCHAPDETRE